jgi:cytosine/adenosine deaminase-related metal-dependent hydrolase
MSPDSALVPQCTILQNGLLVTFTEADAIDAIPAPKRVDVLVVNERIAEIAAPGTLSLKDGESIVVDCSTMWIAPGFVDTHRHLWMSICRGQEDWTLPE